VSKIKFKNATAFIQRCRSCKFYWIKMTS